ncbi:MAG: hypothetical protein ACRD4V_07640 [Candidatus Acidiferrales bacterium]
MTSENSTLWRRLVFRWNVWRTRRFVKKVVRLARERARARRETLNRLDIDPPAPGPADGPTRAEVDEFNRRVRGPGRS